MMHVLSLGAGVQSTTMALMAAHGEITPMPDCAIFADTGAEPRAVYEHLDWLCSGVLPFPVHKVSGGSILEDLRRGFSTVGSQGRFVSAPFFIKRMKPNGASYELALGRRQCTRHYKVNVLAQEERRLLGLAPGEVSQPGSMTVWIGISLDEAIRMKPSRHRFAINRHPLIELRMTRRDCLTWLETHDYPRPPKSACTFCPFRDDEGWREMKTSDPVSFAQAVAIDAFIRERAHMRQRRRNQLFVHRSLKPLADIDFSVPNANQPDLFGNECEGMCGV
jgi:hypothetical protein